MAREYFRQTDIFPTITALITAPDTVAGQTWRCVLPLLGMTFDQRTSQDALISAVFAAAFGGAAIPAGVTCRLLADANKADYSSGFDARQTPLGSICFELQFDGSFAGMTDIPLIFTVAGIATDAPADADITLPTITPNTTDITLKDFQGGTLPGGFYSETITFGGDMLKSVYDTDDSGVVDEAESVAWSGVTGAPASFTPSAHAASHTDGGADEISLDASQLTTGVINAARLPSYVDDVLEYADLASFPVTGETGKIYVDKATDLIYRWSGSAYVQVGGDDVVGIPAGGMAGQVLSKNSGTDYDVDWADAGGGAGSQADILNSIVTDNSAVVIDSGDVVFDAL